MRRLPTLLSAGLVAFGACTRASANTNAIELTDAARTAIADTVRLESAGWKSAAERADANAVLSYYWDAPATVVIRSDQSIVSVEALKRALPAEFRTVRAQTITPRDQRIDVLAGDVAAESAVGDWVSTDTAGKADKQQFAFTRVWARRDGKWRIIHGYLDVRPVATPPAPSPTHK